MDSPVKLVIRAPNQRIEDQTVECMLGWTVKKLKQHLQIVYPNKPRETHQKLIYSGKLLNDEQTLKEVIRQNDDTLHHTVHLVCLSNGHAEMTKESQNKERKSSPAPSSSSSSQDGLRYRGHATPSTEGSFVPTTVPPQAPVQTPPMMMPPGPDMALTPEQYMMMMQTYYYQMAAQYMQYYQPGAYPTPPATPAPEEQVRGNVPQNNPNPAAAPADNNPIMNAQGGIVDDDDDDEFGPRDWLDYVYTFCRFMVLVSIVYFYSNFTRFFAVCMFFIAAYLYQVGYLNWQRWQQGNRPQQQPQQQNQQQQQQPAQQQPANPPQENGQPQNVQHDNTQGQNNTEQENTQQQNAEEQAPPRPGILAITWCFISTFFSSLIPAPPAPVNAN